MNKRYMDFVPARSVKKTTKKPEDKSASRIASKAVAPDKKATTEVSELEVSEIFEQRVVKPRAGVTTSKKEAKSTTVEDYKPKFVKTEVKKRPLSPNSRKIVATKNTYPKKETDAAKVESKGPVTIINKPEKDSKVGLIVTIIVTIILGAAAGTVAFLLLPK